ncbi:GmrSD restriction endonuclease domain-containing protein [Candidatus Poriferisodalis sp.]|uniref:GmrSD restriction endonuclease domain-containing protein n=1 Tax=Candidatus Poriferisodalis sp. TaxID=3101277 RepID=UPI003AF7173B
MTPTLYRDTGYSLTHLVEDIKHGNIALPDIQRPFVWSAAKARDLFDSLYRGYPVGTLMLWETGADAGTRQVGGGENEKVAELLIVDGQQRLTSLYAILTGRPVLTKTFEERQIRVAFCPEDETFEVTDAAIERDPQFIPDITAPWRGGFKQTVRSFLARLADDESKHLTEEQKDELEDRIDRVRDLQNFRFQVIELNASADEEQVAEVFVRTNSEGVKLNQADFILTLMSVHWEKGRQQLELFCRDAVDVAVKGPSPRNAFIDPSPDQLLRAGVGLAFRRGRLQHVYSILRGKDLETGDVSAGRRAAQFDELRRAQDDVLDLTNWHEFLKCLTHAGFRSRRMVTSENALIYTYVLWLIGKRDFGLDLKTLRGVIARWFFMAHTTGRYTSSPESQIEADLGRVAALAHGDGAAFCSELDRLVRANFTGDYWEISLPNRLDTSSARSPVLFAYWAALNLLDAELLFSDLRIRELLDPNVTAPRSIERHHLFPRAYLNAQGVTTTRQVNAIANMAFLDWPENATISAEDPLEYWPGMTAGMEAERLHRQRYWHALPVGWEQLDYPTFLERRRDLIARVVHDGFNRLWDEDPGDEVSSTLADLLAVGESQTVEYKSTARWNLHTEQVDKKLEHVITKTVCRFLNAEGGTLLIGVDDGGQVLGLQDDMATLGGKASRDGYELFLRQRLDNDLSIPTAGVVKLGFERVDDADVCVASVAASGKPVFARPRDGGPAPTEFWVRVGNATKQLHGEDMLEYQSGHWA